MEQVPPLATKSEKKSILRAWLYQALARLEISDDVDAKQIHKDINQVTIEMTFLG